VHGPTNRLVWKMSYHVLGILINSGWCFTKTRKASKSFAEAGQLIGP
jgi:hypothetical protein